MNRTPHYDWAEDLYRGSTLATQNYADVSALPNAVATAGEASRRLFQDAAIAETENHPLFAQKLAGVGERLHNVIVAATTAPAPTTLPTYNLQAAAGSIAVRAATSSINVESATPQPAPSQTAPVQVAPVTPQSARPDVKPRIKPGKPYNL